VKLCLVHMYYVMHKKDNLTQTTIHLGLHDHLVVKSCLREVCEQVKFLVKEDVFRTPRATMLAITLAESKIFLS
jgi:hypothetical protein